MAEREDIRDRIRRINPKALEIMDIFDEEYRKAGGTGVTVDTTEDMTEEEKEMALFEGFIKEGYPPDIADRQAKEWRIRMERLFR